MKFDLDKILKIIPENEKESFIMIYQHCKGWVILSRLFRIIQSVIVASAIISSVFIAST